MKSHSEVLEAKTYICTYVYSITIYIYFKKYIQIYISITG